jgi:disulfide bond formation protein DsbB
MSLRLIYGLGFAIVSLLLLISVYLQIFDNILPCPLCTLQRLSFALLGLLFLLGFFLPKKNGYQRPLQLSLLGTVLSGLFFSGRNIWLQHFSLPNQECTPGIQYLFSTFPFKDALQKILAGSADCSLRGFELLSLDMAEWAFIWFSLFLCMVIYLLFTRAKY